MKAFKWRLIGLSITGLLGLSVSHGQSVSGATFTRVTTGVISQDRAWSGGGTWGDFDNDGRLDLFVANYNAPSRLYRNLGNGEFASLDTVITGNLSTAVGGLWADADNDGWLDLVVPNFGGTVCLYRNDHKGGFVLEQSSGLYVGEGTGAAWADVDNDGLVDLFISNHMDGNILFRNVGERKFMPLSVPALVTGMAHTVGCAWADADNDGRPDLVALNHQMECEFYLNSRTSYLERARVYMMPMDVIDSHGCAWGDFDGDGWIDLFVSNRAGTNILYHNDAGMGFMKEPLCLPSLEGAGSMGCSWADYDNDGDLDLFVANANGKKNFLYRNDGDGEFTRIEVGAIVNDIGNSQSCAWGDYDGDGFPDLFVANSSGGNFLYHNDGNANGWISIRCVGTASNRAGIGAKVKVLAKINGELRWQSREIFGGDAYGSQNGLRAAFGLGDAVTIESIRVEWPSGIVQEIPRVAPRQFLTITEPPQVRAILQPSGKPCLEIKGGLDRVYSIEQSADLKTWQSVGAVTNRASTSIWVGPTPSADPGPRFYRAILQGF